YSSYAHRSFYSCDCIRPDRHAFPTRRSSDLENSEADLPDPVAGTGNKFRSKLDTGGIWSAYRTGTVCGRFPCTTERCRQRADWLDRKSTRLNSSHQIISYAVFCLKKKVEHTV